ncbi:hypothetical protein, partial [Cetobacterium sp.]|uniref:hypothetical protein n=1 Tax=Cetobacterium sp. TaxID=2071632 RepID=UPI003F2F77AF
MSKKHRKISLIFIGFLLALLTIVSFAEPPEAPNQLITENPYKEVKTVEANKNREHAEMNIGVNKLKVKEIEGIELESGEIVVYLPEEKIQNKMIQNEVYYVADSVDIFSETTDRKKKKNVEKNINKIEFERKKDYITIKKNNSKELFLGKIDLEGNALKEIWGIKKVSRALDIGGCQIVIRDWDVIKKYLDIFNTTELTFYYASMGGLLRVSPGNTPSINNFAALERDEYSHTHTGNSSSYDPKAGCLTYTTGSYIKKFDISKGGQLLRHIDLPDTSGGVATMGYIVDSMFYTVYPENELISTFAITKNRYGYKDETNINEHALVYRLNFGGSVSQALKNIDEKFGKDTFEQKFDYTTHRVLTTREHNSIFRINPQIKPAPLGNIDIDLANPMVAGTIGYPPGRIRIYSNSISSSVPLIGNLGNDDMIISSDIKNGQYKLNKASGSYIPINPNELGGNKVDITINTGDGDFKTTREIFTENSDKFNGMMSTAYNGGRGGIEVGVDYQQSDRSNYGTDISLTSWDLEAKNIKVTMKHPLIENIFNISVPEFNAEFYYNKNISQTLPTEIDYSLKVLQGNVIREHSGEMKFKFNIGTKDYDLRILEADNNKINLSIKIPKQVILEVTDSLGNKQSLPFVTEVTASTGILGEDANYYYIHAPNDGWTLNSAVNGVVTLKTMYKTNISITSVSGNNLNLVSIGAKSYRTGKEKRTTIVDKVDLKVELANFNETIDASSLKILENLFTNNEFYGLIQNENRIVLKDGTTEIFNTTLESLKTNPQQILNAGVAIKYNEATNKFEFIKEKYVNYNGNLKLEIRSSNNLLLYIVNLQLINSIIETNAIVTFDRNDFNLVQGDEAQPYGRIRISSTSNSDLSAKMGIIDATDQIVTDKNRKNGQFLQGKITGSTYPLQEHHFGKTIDITVGSHKRSVKIADDLNENPMVTHVFRDQGGIVVYVDYQPLGISNGGIDFLLKLWDGEAKSIPIKVEYPDGAVSNYTVNIPEFEGKNYYNEDLPLANEYLPTKKYTKDINEFMSGELDRIKLGTKDYDLRILGENALGLSNLRVQIPREITLEATDSENNTQNLTFAVSLRDTQNGAASI